MSRKIIVTGGAGFIGSHLVDRLINDGHYITCIDNLYTGSLENIEHHKNNPKFKFVNWDVINSYEFEAEQIYNLASPANLWKIRANPTHCFKTNVYGAVNALDQAIRNKARVLEASTSEVYGDPLQHPQSESYWGNSNPVGERSCYDESKRAAETVCTDYAQQFGLDVRIVRIFNTYGPRMQLDDGRVVNNFIIQALKGEDLTIQGDGNQTRSFCYVDDLVEGILRLMNYEGPSLGPVNIGNDAEYTVSDLAKIILQMTKSKSQIVYQPIRSDDPYRRQPDITKANQSLKWSPTISLETGIDKTIAFFRHRLTQQTKYKSA